MMKPIHIASTSNNKYAKHLGVMLTSLMENKASKRPVIVHIIDGGISTKNKSKLLQISQKYNFQLNLKFLSINTSSFKRFMTSHHITKETYYRISIPDLLDQHIDKVIYLDGDVIVKDDITILWNKNIKKYHLAAVEGGLGRNRKQILPKGYNYFNAGVMLINLEKWRKDNISSKVFNYIKYNSSKCVAWDQDALNAVLYGKWLELHPKWNVLTAFFHFKKKKYEKAKQKPSIIHFAGASKPWHKKNKHRFKNEYHKYLRKLKW
jgi:lipopolysaccharide biosynthesis glycosyltransferase